MKSEMRAHSVYKFYKLFNILWSNQRTRIRKYYIIHIKIQKKKKFEIIPKIFKKSHLLYIYQYQKYRR